MIKFAIVSFAHLHADGYGYALEKMYATDGSAQLVAICDENAERAKAKAKQFDVTQVFNNHRDLFAAKVVDAIVIMSENSKHAQIVADAAAAGVHIICEKPVGISQQDLNVMRDALSKNAVAFQTAFVCRYAPSVMEAKASIESGRFGAIKAISATNHGQYPGGWFGDKTLSGGGAIIDHTVHAADLIRMFTNDEIDEVRCFQGKNIREDLAVEDNAVIYAHSRKGRVPISIDCSWSRHNTWPTWGDLTMTIVCEKGVLQIDAFRPHINVANDSGFRWHGICENLDEKLLRSFCNQIHEIRSEPTIPGSSRSALDATLRADFEAGARAAEVALAAYQSAQNDNAPVSAR